MPLKRAGEEKNISRLPSLKSLLNETVSISELKNSFKKYFIESPVLTLLSSLLELLIFSEST